MQRRTASSADAPAYMAPSAISHSPIAWGSTPTSQRRPPLFRIHAVPFGSSRTPWNSALSLNGLKPEPRRQFQEPAVDRPPQAETDRRHPPAGGVQIDNRFFAFTVPANKLLYLGTVQAKGFAPLQRNDPGAAVGAAIGGVTREKDTLRAFVAECPEVYALYENRVVTY